jgi:hypothetical protein
MREFRRLATDEVERLRLLLRREDGARRSMEHPPQGLYGIARNAKDAYPGTKANWASKDVGARIAGRSQTTTIKPKVSVTKQVTSLPCRSVVAMLL